MPCLPGMHAPGSDKHHLLPPAGIKDSVGEIYRFHRVIPFYPPDPCIRPNEADLVCRRDEPVYKNHPDMPAAGANMQPISDRFAFHQARKGNSNRPCPPGGRAKTLEDPCPCTNSEDVGNPMIQTPYIRDGNAARLSFNSPRNTQVQNGHLPLSTYSNEMIQSQQCAPVGNIYSQNQQQLGGQTGGNVYPQSQMQLRGQTIPNGRPCLANSSSIPNQYQVLGNYSHGNDYITKRNATVRHKLAFGEEPDPACPHPYIPAPYICHPVYNINNLKDCPEQDGPPPDSYTFL